MATPGKIALRNRAEKALKALRDILRVKGKEWFDVNLEFSALDEKTRHYLYTAIDSTETFITKLNEDKCNTK